MPEQEIWTKYQLNKFVTGMVKLKLRLAVLYKVLKIWQCVQYIFVSVGLFHRHAVISSCHRLLSTKDKMERLHVSLTVED